MFLKPANGYVFSLFYVKKREAIIRQYVTEAMAISIM